LLNQSINQSKTSITRGGLGLTAVPWLWPRFRPHTLPSATLLYGLINKPAFYGFNPVTLHQTAPVCS